jgi:hypothetical protein
MKCFGLFAAAAVCAIVASPAAAGTKDFALQGYALPDDKPVTIVLMRPEVDVGELHAGGLPQPNADWTREARDQIAKALRSEFEGRKLNFTVMDEQIPAFKLRATEMAAKAACSASLSAAANPAVSSTQPACVPPSSPASFDPETRVAEYNALHGAVVQAILGHSYGQGAGGKLPTKKDNFAYTLGPGTAQLGEISGANYGIFVLTVDQFSSAARKTMQVMGGLGCLVGFCMIVRGGIHVAYVSLVELETGNVVWFNLLRGSKGDVREEDGAKSMVQAIMTGMPTRPGEKVSAKSAAKKKS